MTPVEVMRGDSPIVLGLPHTGTWLPEEVRENLNDLGRRLADTDWHIDRLYSDLVPGATLVRATFHRYLIDANRDPSGESLYPGQNTTGLVPLTDFDGDPIWQVVPDAAEIAGRRSTWHARYHAELGAEVARIREKFGFAILYDCHSIRSHIPFLFDGKLPDFNIGTNSGQSCAPELERAIHKVAAESEFSAVLNGRFKGGWTTRHYGRPSDGVHAIQMELAQSVYLTEESPPWTYDEAKTARLRPVLRDMLQTLIDTATEMRP